MPVYRYEVKKADGDVLSGAMDAPDETVVRTRLEQRGYGVVRIEGPSDVTSPAPPPPIRVRATAGAADKALFFRQLASLLRAGITPYQAVADLASRTTNPALREAADDMRATAEQGGSLADAMERYPGLFPRHVIGTVHAAQLGGFLDVACDEIALEYEQEIAFYKGMWLPKALVVQGVIAIAIAQPLFPTLFPNNQLGRYLILAFLRNLPIAIALILGVRLGWRALHGPSMAERLDAWTLRVPVFGDLIRQRSLAAFIRMLRRLYAVGLPPVRAWEGATAVVPNSVLRATLGQARESMDKGVPLHEAFRNTGLFASEAEQLLATGVQSGEVVEMLDRVAEYYQRNVERAVESSRFWMYRLAFTMFLVLGGALLILLVKTYFDAVFGFTKGWVD